MGRVDRLSEEDTYDGHFLISLWSHEDDDLEHELVHPPTCVPGHPYPEEMPDYIEYGCIPAWHASECGDWYAEDGLIEEPGLRLVGWRVERYSCDYTSEYDLIVFTIELSVPMQMLGRMLMHELEVA